MATLKVIVEEAEKTNVFAGIDAVGGLSSIGAIGGLALPLGVNAYREALVSPVTALLSPYEGIFAPMAQWSATLDVISKQVRSTYASWDEQYKQSFAIARTLPVVTPFEDFYPNTRELIEQMRRWKELDSEFDQACAILEMQVDENNLDEFYEQMPYTQILSDASAVRWLKTHQGRLHTPEASARLGEFLRTGQLSGYTLGRFWHLLFCESQLVVPMAEFRIPPTNKYEIQIQHDPAIPPQRLIYPVSPGQQPVVRVLVTEMSNQLGQPMRSDLWIPKHDTESQKQSSRRTRDKRTRILCGLVWWRNQQTNESIADICATGIVSEKTFYNYKKEKLIYEDVDLQPFGATWETLWSAYQRGGLEEFISTVIDKYTES